MFDRENRIKIGIKQFNQCVECVRKIRVEKLVKDIKIEVILQRF